MCIIITKANRMAGKKDLGGKREDMKRTQMKGKLMVLVRITTLPSPILVLPRERLICKSNQ